MAESAEDDVEVCTRMGSVRPELDPIVLAVLRAKAEAALFGKRAVIEVGRYQLLDGIGTGGGGSVFAARDPELDREIAIKLVVAETDELRARALAEGQTLARLSHPNIVPVFDVGVADDRVYLVMELIRGESLRAYAARASVREIVNAYRQAGEGLAAAHDAGLVHRDFKPDNAVIGRDGRVRVIDFGLARPTNTGSSRGVGGTPRYMAPEQRRGHAVTPASDQYAFAVSLREAMGQRMPAWIETIVERGASVDPDARYSSMAELLRALANDPRAKWARRALIAAPLTFAIVGFAVGRRGTDETPCDGRAALAPAWTAERATRVERHISQLAVPFATISAPRAREALDRYASTWVASYNETCKAARRGHPTAALRTSCLTRARQQVGELVDLLGGVTVDRLATTMTALSELPDLSRCMDDTALATAIAPPTPAQASEVAAVTDDLERAQVAIHAAHPTARARSSDAVARARTIGYQPLLARALLAHGRAELALGGRHAAVAPLTEATDLALSVGDTATAVEAFARAAWAKSTSKSDAGGATQGIELIAALARRLGPRDQFAHALLHNNAGTIENAAGHVARAREHLETARAIARDVKGPGAVELAAILSNLALITDDPEERARLLAERVAIVSERLGAEHPLALSAKIAAAFGTPDDRQARDALRPVCETYARLHPAHGATIVDCASELAWLELANGDRAGARDALTLVLEARGADIDSDRVAIARAYAAFLDGDSRTARVTLDELAVRTRPAADATWWQYLFAAEVELARAYVGDSDRGALMHAIEHLERAAASRSLPGITRRLAWAHREIRVGEPTSTGHPSRSNR